ncbi:hypothetical protein HMPREF1981_03102 [Bacteroides pyogenes F0041]|uniref:Uncharacterized protein n=1 Tax=Bacteroides pyogenes F0041 TaxID=1321819 RepID=U2DJ75_9BACE|nr:hypothetical protein HMPREF1981_03102 [Bacteroides pyogenes F0041]
MEKQRFYLQQTEPLFEMNRTSIRNGQRLCFCAHRFSFLLKSAVFLILTGFILRQTAFWSCYSLALSPIRTLLSARLGGFSSF